MLHRSSLADMTHAAQLTPAWHDSSMARQAVSAGLKQLHAAAACGCL